MLSTAIVIFREMLEISMILSIVLAATRGLPGRLSWILAGIGGGLSGAGLVAAFAQTISSSLSGMGQEFFNAAILFAAVLLIGWTVVWMRAHAREMTAHLRQVGQEVTQGKLPMYSLALIVWLALLREGSEIVLFIYSMILSGQSGASIIAGSATGVVLGVSAGVMIYYGLLKIPARYALTVTSWLLMLLVAGLAAQGAEYLSTAGYFSGFSRQLWDSSWLLSEEGIIGKSLHTLIGYSARPTAIQLIFYVVTLGSLLGIVGIMDRRKKHALIALLFLCAAVAQPDDAHALDEIYSPNAEPGEIALEYNGSRTFDSHSDKNNAQGHQMTLEYGLSERVMVETSGIFAKDPGSNLKMQAAEAEARFQFFEQGENWLDSGLLVAYDFSTQSHTPDSLEVKLLLQKDIGMTTTKANIGFAQKAGQYGSHTGGPDYVFLWNTRYRYNEYVQPGIETQSDLGQGKTLGQFSQQEHYIGPAVYGRLFGNLKYETAWLFGASSAASQSAARLLVEYEMHF